jgi:hypothetical protein
MLIIINMQFKYFSSSPKMKLGEDKAAAVFTTYINVLLFFKSFVLFSAYTFRLFALDKERFR